MVDADKIAFMAALNELAATKPGAKITREGYAAWWNALRDWSLDEFRAACARLVTESEFMPNPFHFAQLRKAARLTSGEAWAQVLEHIRGRTEEPSDPVLLAAVRALGGFRMLGMTNTDQLQFLERRFAEHYETIGDADDTREAVPQLMHGAPPLLGERKPGLMRLGHKVRG